ncbi:MAG: metalloregulator ArsR/SmtB family transcription factor [Microbacteriaceae bacterium]|nr:metalloregulator ArsR/SmtB family transcription factor [Microbacteriaceae bacterium]
MSAAIDDELWSAIGDPTRRKVLDMLLETGGETVTGLGAALPVTRQAVAKHLDVLAASGLIVSTTAGRRRTYTVDPERLQRAIAQLETVGAAWDRRLDRIKHIAEAISRGAAAE